MEKLLTTPNLSQLKVTRARRARSWGGGEREAMREGRKATSLPMEGDLDSWSESDKAAFRARMGLREDCGVGSSSKHRTTEEEGRDEGQEATELRRERAGQGGKAAAGGKD